MSDYDKETQLVLALAAGASVAAAARKAGCSARTLFRRLENDAFRRQVAREDANRLAGDLNADKNLAPGDWIKYCRFYNLDSDRKRYDLPCDSWRFQERLFGMTQIVFWYNKLERGELTREEYHRLVLDFAARLEAEGSSSSGG